MSKPRYYKFKNLFNILKGGNLTEEEIHAELLQQIPILMGNTVTIQNIKDILGENIKLFYEKPRNVITIILECNQGIDTEIHIHPNRISIFLLFKCDTVTGTHILQKIIKFGYFLKKDLKLTDVSEITQPNEITSISLPIYTLLIHGKTWYNKMGFLPISDIEYKKQSEAYNLIRKMTINEFYKYLSENDKMRIKPVYISDARIELNINDIVRQYNEYIKLYDTLLIETSQIKDIIKYIYESYIQKILHIDPNNILIQLFLFIMKWCEFNLSYQPNLIYHINTI